MFYECSNTNVVVNTRNKNKISSCNLVAFNLISTLEQIEFANILGVDPSNTVMFALGDSKWQEYNRGGSMNRLSFHKYLHLDTDEFIKIIKEEYGNLLT